MFSHLSFHEKKKNINFLPRSLLKMQWFLYRDIRVLAGPMVCLFIRALRWNQALPEEEGYYHRPCDF